MADIEDIKNGLMVVVIVGITFLIMASIALIGSSYKTSIVSTTPSQVTESFTINNGSSSGFEETFVALNTATANNDTWMRFNEDTTPYGGDSIREFVTVSNFVGAGEMDSIFETDWAVSFWIKKNTNTCTLDCFFIGNKPMDILDGGTGWSVFSSGSGNSLNVQYYNGTTQSSNAQANVFDISGGGDRWIHIVVVYNGTELQRYVNGTIGTALSATGDLSNNQTTAFRIGASTQDPSIFYRSLNGSLDEIRIYNKTLSSAEVTNIYNSGRIPDSSLTSDELKLWYSMNENSGTTLFDKSGLNNDGTTTNNPYYQNDGVTNDLSEDVDFTTSPSSFTLINSIYEFSPVTLDYNSTGTNDASDVLDDLNNEIQNNTSIVGVVLTVSLVGIVLSILIGVFLTIRSRRI